MGQPSQLPQEPKERQDDQVLTSDPASEVVGVLTRKYQIVGLQMLPAMPIQFAGREFDLANLTTDEANFLLAHPGQVPYLQVID